MNGLKQRIEQLVSGWNRLQERQQRVVAGGAIFVAVALLWGLAIDPWLQWRGKLNAELPRLRSEFARMQGLAEEAKKIPARTLTKSDPARVAADLQAELTRARLAAQPPVVRLDGADRISLQLRGANFDALLLRIEQIQQQTGARVSAARFTRADAVGGVNAELSLDLPGRQAN